MMYYCERFDTDKPEFLHYKGWFHDKEEAIKFFKQKHQEQLQYVYDENFDIIWEK